MKNQINKYSKTITQDESLPAAQAMLYAIGMSEQDQQKAQVGIVSTGFQGNPCNMHLNDLATLVKKEVDVHISPEAYEGGLIGLVKDGDIITIDIAKNRIDVDIADQEIADRRKEWKQPANTLLPGILKKYRNTVSSASEGCVTTV